MAAPQTNPLGKHDVLLKIPHDLFMAIEAHRTAVGLPRATCILEVLRGYYGALADKGLVDAAREEVNI